MKNIIILSAFFCFNIIHGQIFQYKNYSAKDGLPSSEVYHVMQDSKGFMWFSTDRGVARFDGYSFKTFNTSNGLADNTVFECIEDYKGRIWFRSFSGRVSYYFHDSVFIPAFNDSLISILKNHPVTTLRVDSNDNLYVCANGLNSIIVFNLKKKCSIRLIPIPGEIAYIGIIHSGQPLMGSSVVVDDPKKKNYFLPKNLTLAMYEIGKSGNEFKKINSWTWNEGFNVLIHNKAIRLSGEKYAAALQVHFLILNKQRITFDHKFSSTILNICPDKTGGIWAIVIDGAPAYYKNDSIIEQPNLAFLKHKHITAEYTDNEGGLWFTSLDRGVYYISSPDFKIYNNESGLRENKVYSLTISPDKRLYMCLGSHTIGILDKDSIIYPKLPDYPVESSITGILFHSDSTIWVSGTMGISVFEKHPFFKMLPCKTQRGEFCLAQNRDGSVWAVGYGSLDLFRRNKTTLTREKLIMLKGRGYTICKENENTVWVGMLNGLWQCINDSVIYFGDKYPVFKNRVDDIKKDSEGNLWIATRDTGIILKTQKKIYHITTKDGLLSNFCECIYIDYKNNIWAGSNDGLSKITARIDSAGNMHIIDIKNISTQTLREINQIATINNTVYVGTNTGLTVFNMDNIKPDTTPPPVYITDITINNKAFYKSCGTLNLPYDENYIVLNYIGLTYKNAGNTTYRYKMAGIDTGWIYTKNTNIQYPKLSPGDYTFEVSAMNNDGIWSIKPASIHFIIAPPIWGTWWAKGLFGLIILSIGYWQIKAIEKREKKKTEINKQLAIAELGAFKAQYDPHFMFNSLNTLTHLVENKSDNAAEFVNELSKFYRYSLQFRDKELTDVETEMNQVKRYIHLIKIRFSDQFKDSWNIDEKYKNYLVPTYSLQLLVENVIKHNIVSVDKPLWMEIKTNQNGSLIIKNQLQPKNIGMPGTGHGLASINERYKLLTGKKVVISHTSEYFCVELPLINPTEYESSYS